MPTAAFMNLGCKVNQYETERLAGSFRDLGFDIVDFKQEADVYVVNTCSVTADADRKSRYTARRAQRTNPNARVVLTGCFAQLALDTGETVECASLLVSNGEKMRTAQRVVDAFPDLLGGKAAGSPTSSPKAGGALFPTVLSSGSFISTADILGSTRVSRTRATLKIQDGCRHFCAFCSIPYTRAFNASRPFAEIVQEARELAEQGSKEIVVTGVCVGAYGAEFEAGREGLGDVLRAVADIPGVERVRLSSVQPIEVDEGIIAAMAAQPKIAPHLHLSLQSGDDTVLKAMGRPYDTGFYRDLVHRIRASVPHVGLTTDLIVGFPGETVELFDNTLRFAEEMTFAGTHVFRYSPRQRTAAADMVDDVDFAEKERRHSKLTKVSQASQRRFAESFIDQVLNVLVEARGSEDGFQSGYTENYIRVQFASAEKLKGKVVPVRIMHSLSGGDAFGELVTKDAAHV